jgi:hypothetical protein
MPCDYLDKEHQHEGSHSDQVDQEVKCKFRAVSMVLDSFQVFVHKEAEDKETEA